MPAPYCYWSVATGPYAPMMARCVATAREAGVFRDFHVFADTPIEGCECYDAQSMSQAQGLYKLLYLKTGLVKLPFDYFVWVDADTLFRGNPGGILQVLGKSPIHVPLREPDSTGEHAKLLVKAGVFNAPHGCEAAFWIVKRDAIDRVHELALYYLGVARESGVNPTQDEALGYAMQMLCGNPSRHELGQHLHLWAPSNHGFTHPGTPSKPAILHLGREAQSLSPGPGPKGMESS